MNVVDCEPDPGTTACPKCGFRQEADRLECMGCGLIFDRYRAGARPVSPAQRLVAVKRPGPLRRAYRVVRWFALAGSLVTIALILRNSPPPVIEASPDADIEAETKIADFQSATGKGVPVTLKLDEAELNALVQSRLPSAYDEAPSEAEPRSAPNGDPAVEQTKSNVRDIRLHLAGDSITAYVLFDLHGKEISLILEGKLEFHDGCLRMVPTKGKLGSLPLMEATLRGAARRLFDSPENRDKFCLPPDIQDVRIEGGSLILSSR